MRTLPLALLLLVGCADKGSGGSDPEDLDGDGATTETDCDDDNAAVFPDAPEVCDGLDNDCDGGVDDDASDAGAWYKDYDGDGYGDDATAELACTQPSSTIGQGGDCDDADPSSNPVSPEVCDAADNNCDGSVDEGLPIDAWYPDADGDGFGDNTTSVAACAQPDGHVGSIGDCDDTNAAANPEGEELCDGADNDCDGTTDEDSATDTLTWYADADGDTFGDATSTAPGCTAPKGYVGDTTDCDDADDASYPGAPEVCDDADNDCDGTTDEDSVDAASWYADADGDDYGTGPVVSLACDQPEGQAGNTDDCDDTDAGVSPDDAELCDEVDNDCDGTIDESSAIGAPTWYVDADLDGYGDPATGMRDCYQPAGYVSSPEDCDDADSEISPSEEEICANGVDEDCDGWIPPRCELLGDVGLSTAGAQLIGEDSGDRAGRGVALAGDVNGDGMDDLLIGADGADDGGASAGGAYVALGPVFGPVELRTVEALLVGESAYDYAGYAVAGAGDVDGDGLADVLVGAYGNDATVSGAGTVYLAYGPLEGEIDLTWSADAWLRGEGLYSSAGYAVAGAGDVDGDGLADVLVGAYGYGSNAGRAYLLYGPLGGEIDLAAADALLDGEAAGDRAGAAVAAAGDVNADGSADLLVGAPYADDPASQAGGAYLLHGPLSGALDLTSADARLRGEASGDYAGWSVAGAGDVDGDGDDDVLVGGIGIGSYGGAYLAYGPLSGEIALADAGARVQTSASTSARLGQAVAGAGDVDGDGFADVLVSDDEAEVDGLAAAGAVYLLYGPISGAIDVADADARLAGEAAAAYAGGSLAGGGDTNGDGFSDFLVGADGDAAGGAGAGAAYLVIGM